MTGSHRHGHYVGEHPYVHGHTPLHLMAAEAKIVAMAGFVIVVVCTPVQQIWAFLAYLLMVIACAAVAQLRPRVVLPRLAVELPFVLFAVLMPFFGPPPTTEVLGLHLSVAGLWAAWGILAKATLGVLAAVVLAATTPARDLIAGLRSLRVPDPLVQIASFMLRYVHVVGDQLRRMAIARESRGFEATGPRSWPVLAQSAGALFIRSYERGERVHLAMLARGYDGRLPVLDDRPATRRDWAQAAVLPGAALVVCLSAWVLA